MSECVFGYHSIEEVLGKGARGATLFLSRRNTRIDRLRELAEDRDIPVSEVDDGELSRLCGSQTHRGAVLVLEKTPLSLQSNLKHQLSLLKSDKALVLVLDSITDPQNLGAILRSADQFRVDMVIIPSRRSARDTQTVSRASSGASAYVPLCVVPNIPSTLDALKEQEFWIFGADIHGESTGKADLDGRVCIVMGGEGAGMRRLVKEKCDFLLRIPSAGHVDSFNVSVAAGILLFEARRQQGFPNLDQ